MPGSLPPAFDRFGDQLEQAASDRIERERAAGANSRRRRRRRVLLSTLAAVTVPAAAFAGAASLLDGSDAPLRSEREVPREVAPAADQAVVPASAVADPGGGPPWAVRVFANPSGQQCVAVGRLRGGRLGQIRSGRFRPLPPDAPGACGDVQTKGLLFSVDRRAEPPRTIVYGLAATGASIRVAIEDRSTAVRLGPLGSFVVVFEGIRDLADGSIESSAGSRRIRRPLD